MSVKSFREYIKLVEQDTNTYPPDLGAVWDASRGKFVMPDGGTYVISIGGDKKYKYYPPPTSQGGTGTGTGSGTSGQGAGPGEAPATGGTSTGAGGTGSGGTGTGAGTGSGAGTGTSGGGVGSGGVGSGGSGAGGSTGEKPSTSSKQDTKPSTGEKPSSSDKPSPGERPSASGKPDSRPSADDKPSKPAEPSGPSIIDRIKDALTGGSSSSKKEPSPSASTPSSSSQPATPSTTSVPSTPSSGPSDSGKPSIQPVQPGPPPPNVPRPTYPGAGPGDTGGGGGTRPTYPGSGDSAGGGGSRPSYPGSGGTGTGSSGSTGTGAAGGSGGGSGSGSGGSGPGTGGGSGGDSGSGGGSGGSGSGSSGRVQPSTGSGSTGEPRVNDGMTIWDYGPVWQEFRPKSKSVRENKSDMRKLMSIIEDNSTKTQSDLSVFDQGLTRLFGNLEKREDGNWYFPGGARVTDPRMIAKAERSAKTVPTEPTKQSSDTSQSSPWTDAARDIVTGKKLPSQALGPLVYGQDYDPSKMNPPLAPLPGQAPTPQEKPKGPWASGRLEKMPEPPKSSEEPSEPRQKLPPLSSAEKEKIDQILQSPLGDKPASMQDLRDILGPSNVGQEKKVIRQYNTMESDIKRSLMIMESMTSAEKKSTGPKFPGYWKGTDPASAAKNKMVGGSEEQQESVLGELDKTAKDSMIRRSLEEKYKNFKEQTTTQPAQIGATAGSTAEEPVTPEVLPPNVVRSGTGEVWRDSQGRPVVSGSIPEPKPAATGSSAKTAPTPTATQAMAPAATPAPATPPAAVTSPEQDQDDREPPQEMEPSSSGFDPTGRKTSDTDVRSLTYGDSNKLKSTSWQELARLNPQIKNPNLIYAGQQITAPNGDIYTVQKGDTLSKIATNWNQQMGFVDAPAKPNVPAKPAAPAKPVATGSSAKIEPVPPNAVVSGSGQPWTDSSGRPVTSGEPQQAPATKPTEPTKPAATSTTPPASGPLSGDQWEEYKAGMGQREAYGNYNTTFGDRLDKSGKLVNRYLPPSKDISSMTMAELRDFQQQRSAASPGTAAVGKYGFMPGTIDEYSKKLGIKPDEQFSPAVQEKIQNAIMNDQIKTLSNKGVPVNYGTMYMAQYVGPTGATRVYQAAQSNPDKLVVDAIISPKYQPGTQEYDQQRAKLLRNNPELGRIRAGDFERILGDRVQQGIQKTKPVTEMKNDNKVAGRYSYDEFDDMIDRLRAKAKAQEKQQGPVDLGKLMQRLRDIDDKDKNVKEEESPNIATNPTMQATAAARQATNPAVQDTQAGQQATSQAGTVQQQQQRRDQALDTSTARGVADTIASVAPPGTNPDALAQGIVNANDGKPLSRDQQKAMGTITPLVLKAAETPVAAGALKTALQQAGILAKQGK